MRERRWRNGDLCNRPGRLTRALGVQLSLDGSDLTDGALHLTPGEPPERDIISTTRIGISRGTELPWRYLVEGEKDVSVPPKQICERGLRRGGPVPT